jgi:hypothetical protein
MHLHFQSTSHLQAIRAQDSITYAPAMDGSRPSARGVSFHGMINNQVSVPFFLNFAPISDQVSPFACRDVAMVPLATKSSGARIPIEDAKPRSCLTLCVASVRYMRRQRCRYCSRWSVIFRGIPVLAKAHQITRKALPAMANNWRLWLGSLPLRCCTTISLNACS